MRIDIDFVLSEETKCVFSIGFLLFVYFLKFIYLSNLPELFIGWFQTFRWLLSSVRMWVDCFLTCSSFAQVCAPVFSSIRPSLNFFDSSIIPWEERERHILNLKTSSPHSLNIFNLHAITHENSFRLQSNDQQSSFSMEAGERKQFLKEANLFLFYCFVIYTIPGHPEHWEWWKGKEMECSDLSCSNKHLTFEWRELDVKC